jgi:hypothetical protein
MDNAMHHQDDPEVLAHERTYKAFNLLVRWSMVLIGVSILALTVWFATPGGFWGGLVAGLASFALGYVFVIRHEEKQPLDVWAQGR